MYLLKSDLSWSRYSAKLSAPFNRWSMSLRSTQDCVLSINDKISQVSVLYHTPFHGRWLFASLLFAQKIYFFSQKISTSCYKVACQEDHHYGLTQMESRVPSPKFKWCLCLRHPFGFNNLLYLRQTQFPERCTDKKCPGIYRCNFSRFDVEWSRSTWNEIQLENISAFFEKYENRLCRTIFTGFPVLNEMIVDLCTCLKCSYITLHLHLQADQEKISWAKR